MYFKVVSMLHITLTILNIIHIPVFYLKRNVPQTGFCHRVQVEHTQADPIEYVELFSVSVRRQTGRHIVFRIVIVVLMHQRHRPIDRINLLGS
jgi:hypothetical protein